MTNQATDARPPSGQRPRWPAPNVCGAAVASFIRYADAAAAVEYLATRNFPVERTAIVGEDVRLIEQVVGRVSYGRAALHGAGSGAVPGILIGWLFGVFDWFHPVIASIALALYGLLFGAVIGALLGVLFHALQHGGVIRRGAGNVAEPVRADGRRRSGRCRRATARPTRTRLRRRRAEADDRGTFGFRQGVDMAKAVGIDLGTTNSVIAVWEGGEPRSSPTPRARGPHRRWSPSPKR